MYLTKVSKGLEYSVNAAKGFINYLNSRGFNANENPHCEYTSSPLDNELMLYISIPNSVLGVPSDLQTHLDVQKFVYNLLGIPYCVSKYHGYAEPINFGDFNFNFGQDFSKMFIFVLGDKRRVTFRFNSRNYCEQQVCEHNLFRSDGKTYRWYDEILKDYTAEQYKEIKKLIYAAKNSRRLNNLDVGFEYDGFRWEVLG